MIRREGGEQQCTSGVPAGRGIECEIPFEFLVSIYNNNRGRFPINDNRSFPLMYKRRVDVCEEEEEEGGRAKRRDQVAEPRGEEEWECRLGMEES